MKRIILMVSGLYQNHPKWRFLTDINGNVFWKNFECKNIVFVDGFDEKISDSETAQVKIDDIPRCAECTVIKNYDGNLYFLWTIYTFKELVKMLGGTNTYYKAMYLFSGTEAAVQKILSCSDEIAKCKDNDIADFAYIQKPLCHEILRHVESGYEMIASVYKKGIKERAFDVYEELQVLLNESKEFLDSEGVTINLDFTENAKKATIKGNKRQLNVLMMTIIKFLILNSASSKIVIRAKSDFQTIRMKVKYTQNPYVIVDDYYEDFEVFCAELYAEYLNGTIQFSQEDDKKSIELIIPIIRRNRLYSARDYMDTESARTAKIFLDGVIRNPLKSYKRKRRSIKNKKNIN